MCEFSEEIFMEGFKEGFKIGFKEGFKEGFKIGRVEAAKEMLAGLVQMGVETEEIAEALNMSADTVKQ